MTTTRYRLQIPPGASHPCAGTWFVLHPPGHVGRPCDHASTTDELVGLDAGPVLVEVHADGSVTLETGRDDAPASLELHAISDGDGYHTADTDPDLIRQADAAGWTLVTGHSGQHGYRGPVMHPSECIGGGLADLIAGDGDDEPRRTWWTAVEVSEDDDEPSGWVLAYRDAPAWESFYISQDVSAIDRTPLPTWSVYREWFASEDDEGEPWGQQFVSTHASERLADREASRLFHEAHPRRTTP